MKRVVGLRSVNNRTCGDKSVPIFVQKQTKNRNETGSNLSLGTHLTVLSKRLGRKRCCNLTPDRCLEVCRLTIFASHCNKMLRLLPKIEEFGGIPGLEVYQPKNEYAQRRRLRRI